MTAHEIIKRIFLLPVHFYRACISPMLPPMCRHTPTCSRYCLQAVERHGIIIGSGLTIFRIVRCNPIGTHGCDPVPPKGMAWEYTKSFFKKRDGQAEVPFQMLTTNTMELESPLKEEYGRDRASILEAQRAAQAIAFGPISFQATRMMWKLGVFDALSEHPQGLDLDGICSRTGLSMYAVKVLVEASLSIGTVILKDGKFFLTKTGWYFISDRMTQVNMDFTNDVNYKGFFDIEACLRNGKPEGLKALGDWPTVYEGLSELDPEVQRSWFAFDHFYSDSSFEEALDILFERSPRRILDVGGNTGRFALRCTEYSSEAEVTVMDLPQQIEMLRRNVAGQPGEDRIRTHAGNVLGDAVYPEGFDAVWMSQFLDCFSDEQIVSITSKARKALRPGGRLYVMETFWDRQKYEAAAYCLTMTSLYFTVIANGNSKMYHSADMIEDLGKAGYKVAAIHDGLPFGHSILECEPA